MLYDARYQIRRYGLSGAKARAGSKLERRCLAAASSLLARDGPPTIAYGSPAGVVLPRRKSASAISTARSQAAGQFFRLRSAGGIDLPSGSAARLILVQLLTMAIETGGRTFPFPQSLHAWGREMGSAMGGRSYANFFLQSHLIGNARLSTAALDPGDGEQEFGFVEALEFERIGTRPPAAIIGTDFHAMGYPTSVTITRGLFDHARRFARPLDAAALQLVHTSSWAIDIYIWLAGMLPNLPAPMLWTWRMLAAEFGAGYKNPIRAKVHFLDGLALARAVYGEARVDLRDEGLIFNPAPPPV